MTTAALTLPTALLLLFAVGLSLTSAAGPKGQPPPNCRNVRCARPLCEDPVTPRGKCCPSCANSKCKFEGCVQFRPVPVRWLPDPCKICSCRNGKTTCGVIGCPGFPGPDPCFGKKITPVGSTPSVCCPRCDFGVPETACRAVPFRRKFFSIKHGSSTCTGRITQHKCDKFGYRKNGKVFRCVPVKRNRYVSVGGSRCDPFSRVAHRDVTFCRAVPDNKLFEAEGCDLIVRRQVRGRPGK